MPPRDLTDDDNAILVKLLRETIDADRFPMSPRGEAAEGDPREVRPAGAETRAAAAAEATGRAQHGAAKEAAAVEMLDVVTTTMPVIACNTEAQVIQGDEAGP